MKRYWIAPISFLIVLAVAAAALMYTGVVWPNTPSKKRYPVRGVDVSHYQGEIDWEVLAGQGIDFAFIKATEGSTFRDSRFEYNWEQAAKTDLLIGAYHFFSRESAGETQAENFINTVPETEGMLPPVVDVEVYIDGKAQGILNELLDALEAYYGRKPIIYTTDANNVRDIIKEQPAYDIWIRSLFTRPRLPGQRRWTFWQYSNRGRLEGYQGEEPYIDLNVFNGTPADWEAYTAGPPR